VNRRSLVVWLSSDLGVVGRAGSVDIGRPTSPTPSLPLNAGVEATRAPRRRHRAGVAHKLFSWQMLHSSGTLADRRGARNLYGIVATVSIKDVDQARVALGSQRVSLVRRAPGFVCAYWLGPIDGVGMSIIVFETNEHAEEPANYSLPLIAGVCIP
jgi:hypothetical protein